MLKYAQSRPEKGMAMIVNNLESSMSGAKDDTEVISDAFNKVGFSVEPPKVNLRHAEMAELLRDLKNRNFGQFNIFCLVVISRGAAGNFVVCEDSPVNPEAAFGLGEFVEALGSNRSLSGIPKILIFEYRADPRQPDLDPIAKNVVGRLDPDFFIGQSMTVFTPDTNERPSVFFSTICRTLSMNFKTKTFQDIWNRAQFRISASPINNGSGAQLLLKTPLAISTLWKELILNDFGILTSLNGIIYPL